MVREDTNHDEGSYVLLVEKPISLLAAVRAFKHGRKAFILILNFIFFKICSNFEVSNSKDIYQENNPCLDWQITFKMFSMIRLLTALKNRISPLPTGKFCLIFLLSLFVFHQGFGIPLVCRGQSGAAAAFMNRVDKESRSSMKNRSFVARYFSGFAYSSNTVTIYLKDGRVISDVKLKGTRDGSIALKYRKASAVDSVKFLHLDDIEKVVDANGRIKYPLPPEEQEAYNLKTRKLAKQAMIFGWGGLALTLIGLFMFPLFVLGLISSIAAIIIGEKVKKRYVFQNDKKGLKKAKSGRLVGMLIFGGIVAFALFMVIIMVLAFSSL